MGLTIISLGLFKKTGGPTKTIGAFKDALDAGHYMFCKPQSLKIEGLAINGARAVVSSSLPLLSHFCYTAQGTKEAEKAILESSLVSCHSFYRYHALWVHSMSKRHKIPYWFVPHGILDPWVMQKNRWIKQLYWKFGGHRFLQDASAVIFSTKAERDKAADQFDLPSAEVVPWPVDLVDVSDREKIRERIRRELKISAEAHVLLYFGRLNPMKRLLETIEAFSKAKLGETHLLIVGNEDGITKDACFQLARKHRIEKRVHLVGAVYGKGKYHYMHASDAYISFSYRENFNHTAAESLAAGLPVILSPGNDLRGEISDVECCLNIEDNSIEAAVKAIDAFNSMDLQQLKKMGLRGREWVRLNLGFDLFKIRLLKLYSRYMT